MIADSVLWLKREWNPNNTSNVRPNVVDRIQEYMNADLDNGDYVLVYSTSTVSRPFELGGLFGNVSQWRDGLFTVKVKTGIDRDRLVMLVQEVCRILSDGKIWGYNYINMYPSRITDLSEKTRQLFEMDIDVTAIWGEPF